MFDPNVFLNYLTKQQANELFLFLQKATKEAGLNLSNFNISADTYNAFFELNLPGGYYFHLWSEWRDLFNFYFSRRPGLDCFEETEEPVSGDLAPVLKEWLVRVEKEQSTPNLWETLTTEKALFNSVNEHTHLDDVRPFLPHEKSLISQAKSELQEYLQQTLTLSQEDVKFVHDRLAYLEDASGRLGRKDWVNLALGVLANLVVGLALAPDAAREVFGFVGNLLKPILGCLPLVSSR